MWRFFHTLYGGGPELVVRQQSSSPVSTSPPSYPTLSSSGVSSIKTRSTESLPAAHTAPLSRGSRTMSTCSDSTVRVSARSRVEPDEATHSAPTLSHPVSPRSRSRRCEASDCSSSDSDHDDCKQDITATCEASTSLLA